MKDIALVSADGNFRSQNMLRLAEIIDDYGYSIGCDLELRWLPPTDRSIENKTPPYRIIQTLHNGKEHIVMHINETDQPEDILVRLKRGDSAKEDVLRYLDDLDDAKKLLESKAWEDEADERRYLTSLFMSSKNYLMMTDRHGDKVVYDEYRRKRLRNQHGSVK